MHKRLIEEGFNRRYVLLPMLLAIALVVLGFWISQRSHEQARTIASTMSERQEAMRVLAESVGEALEAESAQRGFLLTGESRYLEPMEAGLASADALLADLRQRMETLAPAEQSMLQDVQADIAAKARDLRESVALFEAGQPQAALTMVRADLGLQQMSAIRVALGGLRERQRAQFLEELASWNEATRVHSLINTGSMTLTVLLLLVLGLLASRDIRRRETFAAQLASQIDARTTELADLSRHMGRVSEAEKHALARELHDELGGLLVAMRIDLAMLRKKIGPTQDADILMRWERVEQGLAQGLELKRRVIEDLRPTLLDNMGLFTALRWMVSQRAEQAQLPLEMEGLDEDVDLPSETAIAVFRTAQEAVGNVVHHAGATRLRVRAIVDDELTLEIADDGRGIPDGAEQRTGSHGLRQMRFRMEGVGGALQVQPRQPRGTTIVLSVPLAGGPAQGAQPAP